MTTNPPVSKPDEAGEAFSEHVRYVKEAIAMLPDGKHSADVIRAIADGLRKRDTRAPSSDSIREKAERVAEAQFDKFLSTYITSDGREFYVKRLADIITAEFQK